MNLIALITRWTSAEPAQWWVRTFVVVLGIIAGQFILYGQALTGRQVLLPLDLLHGPYIQPDNGTPRIIPRDFSQSDQVLAYEPARWFTASEIRAGRWPLWSPYGFTGAPFTGCQWSPIQILYVLWPSPHAHAWMQLTVSLIAGTGAYCACRSLFNAGFFSATMMAWALPLTGFFVLWQGHSIPHAAAFFPWMLWSTHATMKRPMGLSGVLLAFFTYASIVSAIDIAGQSLLVCAAYVLWAWFQWPRQSPSSSAVTLCAPILSWLIGFLLASGMLLPVVDYVRTGARFQKRISGVEERPPIGISALPFLLAPRLQGSWRPGAHFAGTGNVMESISAGHAGQFALLLLAPLAFGCGRRVHAVFLLVIAFVGASWALNVPGAVQFFRLPFLNTLSYNRFVFVTGWATLALAALGVERLLKHARPSLRFCLYGALTTGGLTLYLAFGPYHLPAHLEKSSDARSFFSAQYHAAAAVSGLACAGWIALAIRTIPQQLTALGASALLLLELLIFASPWPLMSDISLYYPPIPILEQLAKAPAGRILGVGCLPPRLNERYQLRDVRGYDAVDPAYLVQLLETVRDGRFTSPSYAVTQSFVPEVRTNRDQRIILPGVLSMMNVRYVILPGPPHPGMEYLISEGGYCIYENKNVLPRTYVPRTVRLAESSTQVLNTLGRFDYDAMTLSFIEEGTPYENCVGTAHIVREHPQEIVIETELSSPGVVVLSDLWYPGWVARVEGHVLPIRRANHAFRGIELPAGKATVVMRYEPVSFLRGLQLMLFGGMLCLGWGGLALVRYSGGGKDRT
jgi:hypothetical protein